MNWWAKAQPYGWLCDRGGDELVEAGALAAASLSASFLIEAGGCRG